MFCNYAFFCYFDGAWNWVKLIESNSRKCLLSECKLYRWILDFKVSDKQKELIFIGLNPSFSDNEFTDNTTKKIIKISSYNNYGKLRIINLFALITKNPNNLKTHKDPVGFKNNKFLKSSLRYWSENFECDLWLGWGNNGTLFSRNEFVLKILDRYKKLKQEKFLESFDPFIIKKTKYDNPIHPLYCLDNSKFIKYA